MLRLMLVVGSLGCVALLSATPAFAAVIDGTISLAPDEYLNVLADVNGETYDPGMDIDKVYLEQDTGIGSFFRLGITVEDMGGPQRFSFSGSSSSSMSIVVIELYDDSTMTTLRHELSFVMMSVAGNPTMVMALLDYAPLTAADYSFAVGAGTALTGAFEVAVKNSLLPNLTGPGFIYARLDDWGSDPDDEITGDFIPEPGTLALVCLGGAGLLRRRRKR